MSSRLHICKILKHCSAALISPLLTITNNVSTLSISQSLPKYKSGCQIEGNIKTHNNSHFNFIQSNFQELFSEDTMDRYEKFNFLIDSLHGFLKCRSVTTAVINCVEYSIDKPKSKKASFSNAYNGVRLKPSLRKHDWKHAWLENYIEENNNWKHYTTILYSDDGTLLVNALLVIYSYNAVNMATRPVNDISKIKQSSFGRKGDEVPGLPDITMGKYFWKLKLMGT